MTHVTVGGKQVCVVRPIQLLYTTSSSDGTQHCARSPVCGDAKPSPAVCTSTSTSTTTSSSSHKAATIRPAAAAVAPVTSRTSCSKCGHVTSSPIDVEDSLKRCPFYFGSISASQANKLLASQSAGTYLLRNSSDQRYPFALSVQTRRGPTSIRISRTPSGCVQLDCDDRQRTLMARFDDIFQLIRHYVRTASNNDCVFLEKTGRADTPIVLTRSLDAAMSRNALPLAVLCTKVVNSARLDRKVPLCASCYVDLLPSGAETTQQYLKQNPFEI